MKIKIILLSLLISKLAFSQSETELMIWDLLDSGEPINALAILDTLNESSNLYTLEKGRALYELSKINESIIIFQGIIDTAKFNSSNPFDNTVKSLTYCFLGKALFTKGDTLKAINNLKIAIDLNPLDFAFDLAKKELEAVGSNYAFESKDIVKGIGEKAPDFDLQDAFGKHYSLSNYFGKPIVLHFGTTWCGSCQSDAAALEERYKEYAPKGVVFFKILQAETPMTLIDYKNHYRSAIPTLIDYENILQAKYKFHNYATTVIIDTLEKIIYNKNDIQYNRKESQNAFSLIDSLLIGKKVSNFSNSIRCDTNSCYIPEYSKNDSLVKEKIGKAIFDNKKNLWVSFTSNKDGNNNIYLRKYKKTKLLNEYQLTNSLGDDYDADITIDSDQTIWITWISNKGGKYNVYCRKLINGSFSEIEKLTDSRDDAFHPRIKSCSSRDVYLTYYKWDTLRNYSRDRDVFYKKYNGNEWENEVRVSPLKPDYDDHTDPELDIGQNGDLYIVWSYDYHGGEYEINEYAFGPTIFYQQISNNKFIGKHKIVGTNGNPNVIDLTPSIAHDVRNKLWCAWSAAYDNKVLIYAKQLNSSDKFPLVISEPNTICIEPVISVLKDGSIAVIWRQLNYKMWNLYYSKLSNGIWTKPSVLLDNTINCTNSFIVSNGKTNMIIYSELINRESLIKVKEIKDL